MNGTFSGENFSPGGPGGGDDCRGAASADCVGVGDGLDCREGFGACEGLGASEGLRISEGDGTAFCSVEAAASFTPGLISSVVKYRKPATQMATIETTPTTTGHNQFGVPAGAALARGFFTCGVE